MKDIHFHEIANVFPMIGEEELEDMATDIKARGLREPIVLYEGKILDGRNRFKACQRAGVEPQFEDYDGDDPKGYVVSLNIRRRHLDTGQRAAAAAELANLPDGVRASTSAKLRSLPTTQSEAAKMMNVSVRSVQTAKAIMRSAPKQFKAIKAGKKTLGQVMSELKPSALPVHKTMQQGRSPTFAYMSGEKMEKSKPIDKPQICPKCGQVIPG